MEVGLKGTGVVGERGIRFCSVLMILWVAWVGQIRTVLLFVLVVLVVPLVGIHRSWTLLVVVVSVTGSMLEIGCRSLLSVSLFRKVVLVGGLLTRLEDVSIVSSRGRLHIGLSPWTLVGVRPIATRWLGYPQFRPPMVEWIWLLSLCMVELGRFISEKVGRLLEILVLMVMVKLPRLPRLQSPRMEHTGFFYVVLVV